MGVTQTRREYCAPIIARVIREVGKYNMKLLRKSLRDAYPWYERKYHPYKIWCDEVRRQLGGRPLPGEQDPNQIKLF